jgi:hypothetical protein
MVSFGDKERALGEAATTQVNNRRRCLVLFDTLIFFLFVLSQFLRNIQNTIINVKRVLGRKWSEADLQEELKSLPMRAVKYGEDDVGFEVRRRGFCECECV